MKRPSTLIAAAATVALAGGLSLGTAAAATAAPAPAAVSPSSSTRPLDVTFNLLVPNAPVTFTVGGSIVSTGSTNDSGTVSIRYTPSGLQPGYYRLVASTSYGITSSIGFSVG